MTTPAVTPKIDYPNVIEATPYNFNVPVADPTEIIIEFIDEDGLDISADITYELITAKSMGSLLFDTNTVEVTWVGAGVIPALNTLTIFRKTSEVQQTVYEFRADISVETAQEVDRLTRNQQDVNEKLDEIDTAIENIGDNINPMIDTAQLVDEAVTEAKIADSAVTEAKIADGAVKESKLGAGSVTVSKIGVNAVTEAKIQDGSVTINKLAPSSVSNSKIADNAVSEEKISNNAITEAKLAQDVLDKFDQNIPFKLSPSSYSPNRVRIESAEVVLNDNTSKGVSTGLSIITFDGIEIDFITGNTYSLANILIGTNTFTFPVPSVGNYRTYLIQAKYLAINPVGKTPISLSVVGGQQDAVLGNQESPKLEEDKELGIGFVTVQESGGGIAPIEASKLITLGSASSNSTYDNNIARITVPSHVFSVGTKLIPVYWNGSEWLPADSSSIASLATHMILDVISATEFTLAFSGRIYYPSHGLSVGAYYFLGASVGVLSLIEADDFSNPLVQVESENYFTLLGWRANEKSVAEDIVGVDRVVTNLVPSTPTIFTSNLVSIYSIQVYDSTRVQVHEDIEIRVDDSNPNKFTLFSSKSWLNLRVDLVGVR